MNNENNNELEVLEIEKEEVKEEVVEKASSNKKNNNTPTSLIIIFVILLVAIFLLPEMEKYFSSLKKKDPVIVEPTPTPTEIPIVSERVLTCVKESTDQVKTTTILTLISYEENLKNVTEEIVYDFKDLEDKENLLKEIDDSCLLKQTTYLMDGVVIDCDNDLENETYESLVTVNLEGLRSEEFDLSKLTPYKYNDNVNKIIADLERDKYKCSFS